MVGNSRILVSIAFFIAISCLFSSVSALDSYVYRYAINATSYGSSAVSLPVLLKDSFVNIFAEKQIIFCNFTVGTITQTVGYFRFNDSSTYECSDVTETIKLPMDVDEGNASDYLNPWGSQALSIMHMNEYVDSSPYGNTVYGISNGLVSGKVGNAFEFTSAEFLQVSITNGPTDDNDHTVMAWVKTSTNNKYVVTVGISGTGKSTALVVDSNKCAISGYGPGYVYVTGTTTITDNNWHLCAFVYDAGSAYVYTDGKLEGWTGVINPNLLTGENVTVGAYVDGTSGFVGYIDEVRFYNYSLSADEIKAAYNNTVGTDSFSTVDLYPVFVSPTPENASYTEGKYIYVNVSQPSGNGIDNCILTWTDEGYDTNETMTVNGDYCYLNLTWLTSNPTDIQVYVNHTGNLFVTDRRRVYPLYCGERMYAGGRFNFTRDWSCSTAEGIYFAGSGINVYGNSYTLSGDSSYLLKYHDTVSNNVNVYNLTIDPDNVGIQFSYIGGAHKNYYFYNVVYYSDNHGNSVTTQFIPRWGYFFNSHLIGAFSANSNPCYAIFIGSAINGSHLSADTFNSIPPATGSGLIFQDSILYGNINNLQTFYVADNFTIDGYGKTYCVRGTSSASFDTVNSNYTGCYIGIRFPSATTGTRTGNYFNSTIGWEMPSMGLPTTLGLGNLIASKSNGGNGSVHPYGQVISDCVNMSNGNLGQILRQSCDGKSAENIVAYTISMDASSNYNTFNGMTSEYVFDWGGTENMINNSKINRYINLSGSNNLTLLNVTAPMINDVTGTSKYFRKWNVIYDVVGVPNSVTLKDVFGNTVYSSVVNAGTTPQTEYYYDSGATAYKQPYTLSATGAFGYYDNSTAFNFSSDAHINLQLASYDQLVVNGQSIQSAINAASDGDVIGIYNGTYPESVVVDKMVTIICQFVNSTLIDGGFNVTVPNVTIQNCNVSGGINSTYNSYGIIAASTGGLFTENHVHGIVASVPPCAEATSGRTGAAFLITGSANNVSSNIISEIAGGLSDSVCGGGSSTATSGGIGAGVYAASSDNFISLNVFSNITGGEGSHYRGRGGGNVGGAGSAIYFASSASGNTVTLNNMTNVSGGLGGYGVVFAGSGSRTGGTGGIGAGVFLSNTVSGNTIQKNAMSSVRGGYAGAGGLQVGSDVYGSFNQSGYGVYFEPGSLSATGSEPVYALTDNDLGVSAADFNTVDGDYIIYIYGKSGLVISGLSLISDVSPMNLGKIAIVNSVNVNVTGSTFRYVNGLSGFTNPSYNSSGYHGTHGIGIYLWNVTASNVSYNIVSNVTGGHGASGGDYALASSGMDAYGIYLGGASEDNIIQNNVISSLSGGLQGYAADYTAKDGSNGTAFGIFLEGDSMANDLGSGTSVFNIQDSDYIVYLYNKNGLSITGLTLTSFASTTNYGKIALVDTDNTDVIGNTIANYIGESGDMVGSFGGIGSYGAGVYVFGGSGNNVSSNDISEIEGGLGGSTNQNAHGGTGGIGAGIMLNSSGTNFVGYNSIYNVSGGRGGNAHNDGLTYKGDGGAGAAVYLLSSTGNTFYSNEISFVSGGLQGLTGIRAGVAGIPYKFYPKPITALEPNSGGQILRNGFSYYINWTRGDNDYGDFQIHWSTVQGVGEELIDSSVTMADAGCDSDLSCNYTWAVSGLPSGVFIFTFANESNDAGTNSSYGAFTSSPPDQPTNEEPYNGSGVIPPVSLQITVTDPDADVMDVYFYNGTDDALIGVDYAVASGGVAQVVWSINFTIFQNYTWFVNVTDGIYVTTSGIYQFMANDEPRALNMRVHDKGTNYLTFKWDNAPDNEWISLKILEQSETIRTALTTSDEWTANHELLKWNTVYNFTHYSGDIWGVIGGEYSFLVRTEGWLDELTDFPKKRLVTVKDVPSDLESYAVNVTLDDEGFNFGSLGEPDTGADFRFVDFEEVSKLNYTLQYINVTQAGGTATQIIPNATRCDGVWVNCNHTYDGDMNTFGSPFVETNASVYFNFTKPSGSKPSSKVNVKDGEGYGWWMDVPTDCWDGDTELKFRALASYNDTLVVWQCQNNSDQSWYTLRSATNYYHVYHIEMTWFYQANVWLTVYLDHLDGDYEMKFWMYYGKSGASSESQSLSYSGVWQNVTIGPEIELEYPLAVLSNLTVEAINDTAINVSWDVDPTSDNWVRYSFNPWFVGENMTGYFNESAIPKFNISGLQENSTYYIRAMSCVSGAEETCGYADANITLGSLPSVPIVEFLNYTEDRPNEQVTVCLNLTDADSQTVDLYFQYWEEDTLNEFFNESSKVTGIVSAPMVSCFIVPVVYGKTFFYRAVAEGDQSTGYSDAYENEFRVPEFCFAGSPITDDDDNRVRLCSGYREGSCQREDSIWIETNVTGSGNLRLRWWNGTVWAFESMSNTSDMWYIEKENLVQSWYTFEVWNDTMMVINWTKPSLSHPLNQPNQNERKYVSFGCIPEPLEYKLLYMEGMPRFNYSVYRWCIESGGDLYECMMVEYYGGGRESGLGPERSGTLYDAGELFRGGIWNGESFDTGVLNPTRGVHTFDKNKIRLPSGEEIPYGGQPVDGFNADSPEGTDQYRYCFAFLDFWWNETIIPSNGIRNYYTHYWHSDSWWSIYFWHAQNYVMDYNAIFSWQYDLNAMTRDFHANPSTMLTQENDVIEGVAANIFNATYPESLGVYFKEFSEIQFTSDDDIYDYGLHLDAMWTNVMFGRYQQAFVIFNLPDNATLQGMDSDSDNLTDFVELFTYYTNPFSADTDEGGFTDGQEINFYGTNPNIWEDDDNSLPVVDVYYPVNGTVYPVGNVTIFGVVYDAHLDLVFINDSRFNNTGNLTDFNFVATGLPDGTYYLRVTANDTAFNVKSVDVMFKVDTSPPFIYDVSVQPIATPLEDSVVYVSVNFSADDVSGVTGAVHYGKIYKGSESVINSSCRNYNISATARRFECTLPMQYYYAAGIWAAELHVCDLGLLCNTSLIGSLTYNELKAWVSDTSTISFGSYMLNDGPTFPDYVTLRNTGNVNQTNITITAYSLVGVSQPTYLLPVDGNVFKAGPTGIWATSTGLLDGIAVVIDGAYLDRRGSGTGLLTLYFGIDPSALPSETAKQVYVNDVGQEWYISS